MLGPFSTVMLVVAGIAIPTLPAASAEHGCGDEPDIDAAGTYVDLREEETGTGIWIYFESNGEAGLQRGGSAALTGDADTCQDSESPDTLVV